MFKLENYITPIILNHVAKYVKNIRPEDSQVSLWEGEVAFQNLDLRLDVLEEELNLPFEILSGHIHELSILVPWMKIASEPIKITINTIEFVLKLRDHKSDTQAPQTEKKRPTKEDDNGGVQQSLMPGLVNKIINNIVINCHNIILKYVEEDIVVSMNIQLLSLTSADEFWKPAFIDIHPVRVFMRKLVKVSDLTICLDKRNAAGQIDVCQEPFLYRCSLEIRIIRKYNANVMQLGCVTKVSVFTKLMEMNVSSLQFPMAMRVFDLIMALKGGKLHPKALAESEDEDAELLEGYTGGRSSFVRWVWNLLPSFDFTDLDEEDKADEDDTGLLTDFAFYIEHLNFTLKHAEFITDSIVGATKKIRYSPIVKVMLGGLYTEALIISDRNWFNVKGGCSSITVEPLGSYKEEECDKTILVTTAAFKNSTFLDRGLFDEKPVESDWIVTNFEEYSVRVTEEYLLYRTPVIAFDLMEYKEQLDPEKAVTDDDRRRVVYRILANDITFRFNPTYTRIVTTIQELIDTYDYPPYYETEVHGGSPKLHPPLLDDFDSLMAAIPLTVYKFNLTNINIELHARGSSMSMKPSRKSFTASRKCVPHFELAVDKIEGQWTTPLNPNKLVHTTCQLPDKPQELLNACYENGHVQFKNVSLSLVQTSGTSVLCHIPKGTVNVGYLLQPTLWKNEEVPQHKLDISLESVVLEFSKCESTIALRLLSLINEYDSKNFRQLLQQASIKDMKSVKIRTVFTKLCVDTKRYISTKMFRGCLKSMQAHIMLSGVPAQVTIPFFVTTTGDQGSKWVEWYLQIPNQCTQDQSTKCILALWIEEYAIHIDEHFVEFLKFIETELPALVPKVEPTPEVTNSTQRPQLVKQTSKKSLTSERQSRRTCYPEETIHFSSERDEKVNVNKHQEKDVLEQSNFNSILLPYVKSLVVKILIAKGQFRISPGSIGKHLHLHSDSFTLIRLPYFIFNSAGAENINRSNVQNEFQNQISKSTKDTFPWTCSICDFSVENTDNSDTLVLVHPIQTAITIALTHKIETVNKSKEEPLMPQNSAASDESETDKNKHTQLSTPTLSNVASTSPVEALRKAAGVGSVSGNGRSQTSEENEQKSKGVEKKKKYLQETVENIFANRKKSQTKDVVSVSLHIDTSPISVKFDSKRTDQLHNQLELILKILSLFPASSVKDPDQQRDTIQIVTCNEDNDSIKHFLEIDTNSESSLMTAESSINKFVVSIFLQWTITKFTVEFEASEVQNCKLVFDFEDLISSVDKREDFTKITTKVGSLNARFFEMNSAKEFGLSERFRIKMQASSTQSPLFNMIITTVGVKNFFNKIGAKRKDADLRRAITEIIVKMEALEVIVDMDELAKIAPTIMKLTSFEPCDESLIAEVEACYCPNTVNEIPLVHMESKGLTLYMPLETKKRWCSVAILKIGGVKVTPSLENPLQRSPVRPDVYQKAAQMGILSTPGSIIEDRQYELSLQNVSAASGNWNEVLAHMRDHVDNFHNTNPAFEWNNQSRKTSLKLRKIFSNFMFVISYAPCITCNNVLICGEAIEYNCSNDLVASLTTDQITLFSSVLYKMLNIHNPEESRCRARSDHKFKKSSSCNKTLPSDKSNGMKMRTSGSLYSCCSKVSQTSDAQHLCEESSEFPLTDSGFSSSKMSISKKALESSTELQKYPRQIPSTTSFVAGTFVINLYKYKRTVLGIPQGDELSIEETLTPLISIDFSQPSFLISRSIYEVSKRFSIFNFSVNLFHTPDFMEGDELEEHEKVLPNVLFETKRGEVGSSGIPPPLVVIKAHQSKTKKVDIDISFSKPGVLRLTEKSLLSLTKNLISYYEALLENPCLHLRAEVPIIKQTKLQLMRNIFFSAERFNLKVDMLTLKYTEADKYNFKVSIVDFRLAVKFSTRPEKMNAKASVGGICVQNGRGIVVHPIGFKCNLDTVQESWNRLPLITASIKFNVIRCTVGVEIVTSLKQAFESFYSDLEKTYNLWEEFLQSKCGDSPEINRNRLLSIYLPEPKQRRRARRKEEFYQDDLRAGAFQFVEMLSDSFLPMPYQIQIIKKNYGIICWRYPQPRMMSKIHIFPVPMAVPNPIRIKCRMEYFSDAHESFLHYCDFWLSETVSKIIDLPERVVTAQIWRVVILQSLVSVDRECFDTSEEDEELRSIISIGIEDILNGANKETDFILHPKVLVGCMRIDTIFRVAAIPKAQVLLNVSEIQVDLQNYQSMTSKLPIELKKFKLSENYKPFNQTFLSIRVQNTSLHASFLTRSDYSIHSEMNLRVKCLDYGYLNQIFLIEPTNITGYFKVVNDGVESNVVADRLCINIGPSILHSLICAKQNWEGYLKDEAERKTYIVTKFIVVNRTLRGIAFGQTGTNERILLNSRECCKYSFQSECSDQHLTFYITNGKIEHASDSIPIALDFPPNSQNIYTHAKVDNKCLIIRIRRLSVTQYYILIKGQIELISMVPDVFLLDFYENEKRVNETEIRVEKKDRASYVQSITSGSEISIRLRMFGEQGKGQTGNIPLKSNKNYPWLVKVPVVGAEKFVSYWVRIVRECINQDNAQMCYPQRILITIWPIFEMRSLMTCPMTGCESTTKQEFDLAPEGQIHPLKVPATHQTDHWITFPNEFNNPPPEFNLTLKAVDWNKFFWYNENVWTIEHALNELGKPERLKWPINDEEELRIRRPYIDNTDTTILYKCFPSRDFSCSIRLEVAPWGTFINATAEKISVCNKEAAKSIEITPNSIAMIPQFKSEFTIDVSSGVSWISSLPIVFDKSVSTARRKCYRVNENEATDIVILKSGYIYKLRLQFVVENERNIFILKPKYVIANMSKYSLSVLPFALDHKESIAKKDVVNLSEDKLVAMPTAATNEYSVGICVDGFHDVNKGKAPRTTDTAFVFFLSICVEKKSEISIPLTLMHTFNRKCFSVQYNERSIPFMASLLEKNGQFFVNIFEDTSPMVKINNQTDLTLIVGQTHSRENNKVSEVIPEYDGKHFEWQQLLSPRSELYYTPPISYTNFPDVETSVCNLSIALYNENQSSKTIKWSNSIPTDSSWEKFLHVPSHGDVKIVVCNKHHITRLSIFYIAQQLEFSVKDLRSRLLTPHASNSQESLDDNAQQQDDAAEILNNEPLQRVKPTVSSKCIHQLADPASTINSVFKVRFAVEEIIVKIFVECKNSDYLKKEIFGLYIDNFLFKYDNNKRLLSVLMSNLQIDNQLFSSGNYDFPVVLCSQELYKRTATVQDPCVKSSRGGEPDPMVDISVIFYDDEFRIRSVGCRVSPVRAYIEDTYLNDLLDYLVECAPSNVVVIPSEEKYYVRLEPGEYLIPKDIAAQALCISEPLKMQYFRIDAMNVMLSVHTCVRLYIALDHSPLQFSTYERRDILTLPLRFGHTLGMHYLSGALFGAGWVVGSLEMLGSPSGLARSFSVGLKDFVSMPVQGLLRGPWGFVVGITQGSASLLRNVTAGTVNSVTKLAASVSRNLDRLTLDDEHIQRTEALRRCRPQGFTEGFTQGITGLGISILGAVGGIARHTLEARSATEVMTGVGKGIVGAFTKPISGAAELVALTGQGVLHTVGFNAMPQQRAPSVPRNIAAHASEHKLWLLILSMLPSVMEQDQILFYHEVTLLVNDKLSPGSVFLSSSILALFEMENNRFSFMNPVKRLDVTIDPNDKTLVNISLKNQPNEVEEDSFFTNQRIMRFLESSSTYVGVGMTTESLDHLIKKDFKDSSDTPSFYINENLGQYLIQYLRIINLKNL